MNAEDRLRAAIAARTNAVEPSPDGLSKIEERLMEAERHDNRNRWFLALGSAAAVAVLIVAVALRDEDPEAGPVATPTTEDTTTTVAPDDTTTTTTEAAPPQVDPAQTIFPDPATSRRFDDPKALVTVFVDEFVGMTSPVVGEFQQGDSRSGEVHVKGFENGAPATVLVRQMEDDTWFVIGAFTDSIQPSQPTNGATVTSPIDLQGMAYAFEGTVGLRLTADGFVDEPLATGFVTGRGDGVLGPYEGELEYSSTRGATYGVLLYTSESGEDGAPIAFVVQRVRFG